MPATVSKSKILLADAGLFYAAAIWGSTFIIVKDALNDVDPVTMVAYRFLLAGAVMLIFLLVTGRPIVKGIGRAAFLSVILWMLYIPQTVGLEYTTASNSGFITGLFIAFVPLFHRTIFKGRPTIMQLAASGIALIGLWILTGGLSDINIGDCLTIVAAMTYALHLLYSDRYMKEGVDPYVISCQQFILVGLFSLVTALVMDLPLTVGTMRTGWMIVFLAVFPTLSAFVIQMLAQKITTPLKVSLIFAFEPLFAAIFAWTIGGEEMVRHRAFGGLLIFLALIISGLPNPRWFSAVPKQS